MIIQISAHWSNLVLWIWWPSRQYFGAKVICKFGALDLVLPPRPITKCLNNFRTLIFLMFTPMFSYRTHKIGKHLITQHFSVRYLKGKSIQIPNNSVWYSDAIRNLPFWNFDVLTDDWHDYMTDYMTKHVQYSVFMAWIQGSKLSKF